MANILLAWELGGGYGHLAPLRVLAEELQRRGHKIIYAVRDLAAAAEVLAPATVPILQAPLQMAAIHQPLRVQVSYASLLHNSGFDHVSHLAARLRAWAELLQAHRCELLVTDHAPSAVAAARGVGLPVLQLGTGFTVPPRRAPYPLFRPGLRVSEEVLRHNEQRVGDTLAGAFAQLGWAAPDSLQSLFGETARALCSYPELDHYGARHEPYLGLPDMAQGEPPVWPDGDGPRLFGYLRPGKSLAAALAALQRLPARVLLRVGGIDAERLRGFERPGLRILDRAVNLRLAARDCDAYVHYAAHGTTAEMLLAGKPGLLLPETVEQNLVALRATQLGAALTPPPKGDFNLSAALRQLLDDVRLRNAAAAFAARYAAQDRSQIVPRLADQALAAITRPRRGAPAGS